MKDPPACTSGKRGYLTLARAQDVLLRMAAETRTSILGDGKWRGAKYGIYECPECGRYHVGHAPGSTAR